MAKKLMPGRVETYVHSDSTTSNKGGSMVRVTCQTDFAAKSPEFVAFCKEVAMLAYAFQSKDWEAAVALAPDLPLKKEALEAVLKEKITITDMVLLTMAEEVVEVEA